jgi:hypothetical protein
MVAPTHRLSRTPEYRSWCGMMYRCYNDKSRNYKGYGGRGIKVAKRWHKFENFLEDMGLRPSIKHTLDRENNNKGYYPDNCRWATALVQSNNRGDYNSNFTYKGKTKSVSQWAVTLNIPAAQLRHRLGAGQSFEYILENPYKNFYKKTVIIKGKIYKIKDLCIRYGITTAVYRYRRKAMDWSLSKTLKTPLLRNRG